jgi:alkylation response protein AidB-like acyl-CoA dehydrogenase
MHSTTLTDEEAEAFAERCRGFLDEHARPGARRNVAGARAFQGELAAAGLAGLAYPTEFGGAGLTLEHERIYRAVAQDFPPMAAELVISHGMCLPVLNEFGTDEQKRRFMPDNIAGRTLWCQMFSEPGAGSDVASLQTRAERDGDEFVLNGQKVWTTLAHESDYGIVIARTDAEQPKHAGISMFIVDLRAPGVEIRPIHQIDGGRHFNEVFFTDVRVPAENLVGGPGAGWTLARTTLMHERLSIGSFSALDPFERVAAHVRSRGGADPALADELARLYTWAKALDLLAARVRTRLARGQDPGPGALVLKNAVSDVMLRAADLGMRALGADALAAVGPFHHDFLFAPSMHIGGGTEEVVKGVAAEQGLGLPREPDASKGVPFEALPRSGGAK